MKVERWEEETDEEWAERLAEEIELANATETTQYFVERDPYVEENFIINYIGETGWTWKEHPEGPFSCKQVLEWNLKAEKWNGLIRKDPFLLYDFDKIVKADETPVLLSDKAYRDFVDRAQKLEAIKNHWYNEVPPFTMPFLECQDEVVEKYIQDMTKWGDEFMKILEGADVQSSDTTMIKEAEG